MFRVRLMIYEEPATRNSSDLHLALLLMSAMEADKVPAALEKAGCQADCYLWAFLSAVRKPNEICVKLYMLFRDTLYVRRLVCGGWLLGVWWPSGWSRCDFSRSSIAYAKQPQSIWPHESSARMGDNGSSLRR